MYNFNFDLMRFSTEQKKRSFHSLKIFFEILISVLFRFSISEIHSDSKQENIMYSSNGKLHQHVVRINPSVLRKHTFARVSIMLCTKVIQFPCLFSISDSMFFETAHFESSQRGSCVLIYDGRRFTRDGKFTETTNWRCCYFRDKCRARAITRDIDGVTRVRVTFAQHTCTPKRVKTDKLYDR